ncbi:hypothetical protein O5623_07125 [Escherichia coli]|nr:hypothetical protein [Escherichia coli]
MSSRDHLRRKKKHKNNLARSLIDKTEFPAFIKVERAAIVAIVAVIAAITETYYEKEAFMPYIKPDMRYSVYA